MIRHKRLCIFPRPQGVGGMVSFQARLSAGLSGRGWEITHDPASEPYDALLVIGGTRHLGTLLRVRRRGVPIIQRLNGMNWLQRKRRTGLRHTLRAEMNNLLLALIRRRLAARIVYQSRFSRAWWEKVYGPTPVPWDVIYNGVDTAVFSPSAEAHPPGTDGTAHILMVEGTLGGGYEMGLETGIMLGEGLRARGWQAHLTVAGVVPRAVQKRWEHTSALPVRWAGLLDSDAIPELDRSAHLFYAADLHPACPNAVIEALACGLPCVAFDTGALSEIIPAGGGAVVPYGGDAWNLDAPDLPALTDAAEGVLRTWEDQARMARRKALEAFDLNTMLDAYIEVFARC